MRLRIEQLKKTLHEARSEASDWAALCESVKDGICPTLDTNDKIHRVAEDINARLDALASSGRTHSGDVPAKLLERFATHPSYSVRKVVAKLAPVGSKLQLRMLHDISPAVRSAAAAVAPLPALVEAAKKFSDDDNMQAIARKRYSADSYISSETFINPDPKLSKGAPVDTHGDAFYESLARKMCRTYDGTIERGWVLLAAKNYCTASRATSGVYVDPVKLAAAINEVLDARQEAAEMKPIVSLREVAARLSRASQVLTEDVEEDPRASLESFSGSDRQFMSDFAVVYRLRESAVPHALRKYLLSEGFVEDISVPTAASSPTGRTLDERDEDLLDRFVEAWNRARRAGGEPIEISWSHGAVDASRVTFSALLK